MMASDLDAGAGNGKREEILIRDNAHGGVESNTADSIVDASSLATGGRDPEPSSFLWRRSRLKTALDEVPWDQRHFVHKYWLRWPRPLQYQYRGKTYESGDVGQLDLHQSQPEVQQELSHGSSTLGVPNCQSESSKRSTDNAEVQRERLELFVDLLFVGIISNISEHFFVRTYAPNASFGLAVLEFIILFMPIWTVWSRLQLFLNAWYMDDLLQRIIVVWVLILSLVYGNNVPFFLLGDNHRSDVLIVSYLIAKMSLVVLELCYSIFVPWLRRYCFIGFVLSMPSTAIWTSAILTNGWTQASLVLAGIFTDYIALFFFLSPLGQRALGGNIQKARDERHMMKRYENFFVIALGEGVILLIRGSPAGRGLNLQLGNCTLALLILFMLHYLYFNADQTRHFVHAVYRRWYLKILWGYMHIPLFMNLVLLSSGILYLVKYTPQSDQGDTTMQALRARDSETKALLHAEVEVSMSRSTFRIACAAVCINTSVILFAELIIALLNRPLDPPKTLLVNNRYARLIPRVAAIVILLTVWLHDFEDASSILGIISLVLVIVLQFEWHTSMERGGGFLEPKAAWQR